MKYIILLMLLYILLPIVALANPDCLPGDPDADSSLPHVYSSLNPLGGALYVWCDVGHKWAISTKSIVGAANEFDPAVVKAAVDAAAATDSWAAAHAAAAAKFVPGPADAALLAAIKALPTPMQAPPSGWVTQSDIAYRRQDAIGSNTLTPIGKVPLGVACKVSDSVQNPIGTYHALLDRSLAVMTKVGNYIVPRPTTVYVKCKP